MCNEYHFQRPLHELMEEFSRLNVPFDWAGGAPNLEPLASIRPTDPAPVVVSHAGGARLMRLRWGFPGPRGPVINVRSEGRHFPTGRCIAPADGFYEFTGTKAPKSKWLFEAADGGMLGIAGLVRDDRFTLLTCAPGPDMAPYHDRQVAILPRRDWAAWLGEPGEQPPLDPLPAGSLRVTQVR
ncbi:SOS response-associated peptidase [Phenylobacterium sp.]|uniref:SOS response-associated peptidase n=1 Tax=Phenylobacterium sp. TaxID=1871053 RepID=UPI003956ED16